MRPSKRIEILDAALSVVEDSGVTAVTFDSVAEAAGLTKGGLLYHFPTRDALLQGLHEHLAELWEAELVAAAGKSAAQATASERISAYARVATRSNRAELLLMLESVKEPARQAPWHDIITRWTSPLPQTGDLSPIELNQFIARLASDGLWLHDALSIAPLHPDVRRQVADHLATLSVPTRTQ